MTVWEYLGQATTVMIVVVGTVIAGRRAYRSGRDRAKPCLYDRSPFADLIPGLSDRITFVDPKDPEAMARAFGTQQSMLAAALDGAEADGVEVSVEATAGIRDVWMTLRDKEADLTRTVPVATTVVDDDDVAGAIWTAIDYGCDCTMARHLYGDGDHGVPCGSDRIEVLNIRITAAA